MNESIAKFVGGLIGGGGVIWVGGGWGLGGGGGIIFTGTSLVVPKKVPAVYGDFDFFFSKKPQILKIQVCFFSTYKCF